MRQILQHLDSGKTELLEIPSLGRTAESLLIKTSHSLVSLGTEKMLVEFGKSGWIKKIKSQPEKAWEVISKIKNEGLFSTLAAVRSKLAQPIPLGYCQVGEVMDNGGDAEFKIGDRVVSNGPHAEVVSVKSYLCEKIPDNVSYSSASFTPLAAIALNAIRLMDLSPGKKVIVSGLGLIGQLAVRILRAQGVEVYGIDTNADRCILAEKSGATCLLLKDTVDPVTAVLEWTTGQGVDGVLITAASPSNTIISQSARSCKYHGKIVLVGVIGLNLNRADFQKNEISFQVSNSYGVRTAIHPFSVRDNFSKVLALMSSGQLHVDDLITSTVNFKNAPQVYEDLNNRNNLGISLVYNFSETNLNRNIVLNSSPSDEKISVGIIGAGNFTQRTLLPALQSLLTPPHLGVMVSAQGATAVVLAKKYNAAGASTDADDVLQDKKLKAVFITTRHSLHAAQVLTSLESGQSVWVEKPLALNEDDLNLIEAAAQKSSGALMVGFNRRFAPLAQHVKSLIIKQAGPINIEINVNAGFLPIDHWTLNPQEGGGRIVGEGCHFVDLIRFFVGLAIERVEVLDRGTDGQDSGKFKLFFKDKSTGVINYLTHLPKNLPKEIIKVSGQGWHCEINNWRNCRGSGLPGINRGFWPFDQMDKGHHCALTLFILAIQNKSAAPIPLEEILEVSRWSVRMQAMTRPLILK